MQWGQAKPFKRDNTTVVLVPLLNTGGTWEPATLYSQIASIELLNIDGDKKLGQELFHEVATKFYMAPYSAWLNEAVDA